MNGFTRRCTYCIIVTLGLFGFSGPTTVNAQVRPVSIHGKVASSIGSDAYLSSTGYKNDIGFISSDAYLGIAGHVGAMSSITGSVHLGSISNSNNTTKVGLVIAKSPTETVEVCVSPNKESVSGIDILNAASATVSPVYAVFGSNGVAVCALAGVGGSSSNCFAGGTNYWSYWRQPAGTNTFNYSGGGASNTKVRSGDVEAWVWGTGSSQPPNRSFDSICPPISANTSPSVPPSSAGNTVSNTSVPLTNNSNSDGTQVGVQQQNSSEYQGTQQQDDAGFRSGSDGGIGSTLGGSPESQDAMSNNGDKKEAKVGSGDSSTKDNATKDDSASDNAALTGTSSQISQAQPWTPLRVFGLILALAAIVGGGFVRLRGIRQANELKQVNEIRQVQ